MMYIATPLVLFMVSLGGIRFFSDDPPKRENGKRVIIHAVTGAIMVTCLIGLASSTTGIDVGMCWNGAPDSGGGASVSVDSGDNTDAGDIQIPVPKQSYSKSTGLYVSTEALDSRGANSENDYYDVPDSVAYDLGAGTAHDLGTTTSEATTPATTLSTTPSTAPLATTTESEDKEDQSSNTPYLYGAAIMLSIVFPVYVIRKRRKTNKGKEEKEKLREWVGAQLRDGEDPKLLKKALENGGCNPSMVDVAMQKL